MEGVFKKVYVLLHTTPDGSTTEMGEANDQEGLQKLYDALNETLVLTTIEAMKKEGTPLFLPKTKLRIRYCSKNGVYLQNVATEPVNNLVNTHDEFFRYFEKYKRNLYGDRAINQDFANTLLKAMKEEPVIREQIRTDEKNWFADQVASSKANKTPIIISSFPKFSSHEHLNRILKESEAALKGLVFSDKS
jgi:hypothetical protein